MQRMEEVEVEVAVEWKLMIEMVGEKLGLGQCGRE